jgi:DNA transposase THAP9
VVSLTLDGCATNLNCIRELGCSLKPPILSSFPHPIVPGTSVFVFLDVCHMIKLLRNLWAKEKNFQTHSGLAQWSFMERLVNFQKEEHCSGANKITQKHLDWESQPMKVSLVPFVIKALAYIYLSLSLCARR